MSKTFSADLARRISRNKKDTDALISALTTVTSRLCGELHSYAIPGFGTFVGEKRDEEVVSEGGKTLLVPPSIKLKFTPASKLRKIAEKDV